MVNTYEIKGLLAERTDQAPFDAVLWWEERSGGQAAGHVVPAIYANSAVRETARRCRGKAVVARGFVHSGRKNGTAFYIVELRRQEAVNR